MLAVEGLHFAYGTDQILRGVDLDLPAGCAVGLLGANGAGKSTMLGAITNSILGTSSGRIEVDPAARGPIGYATQNVALYRHLTVRENLVHAARITAGEWKVDRMVDAISEEFGITPLLGESARTLSGGQARIAHLACSFVHRPTIRLLDEPTTALDFETRNRLIDRVKNWREEGIATLVTAHYPEDIEELCTELVVLVDGRTHALGSIEEHLRSLGTTGSITMDGDQHDFEFDEPSIRALAAAMERKGIPTSSIIDSVKISSPSLREFLRLDPSLRSAVAESAL